MPRVKAKPERDPAPTPTANGSAEEVLNLAEAAAYLRVSEADVLRLINEQGLPARQVDKEWRLLKTALQVWLSTGPRNPQSEKAAQLAIVGSLRDDPNLEAMVEEIYRRRGRPITEDGSYRLFHGLSAESDRK